MRNKYACRCTSRTIAAFLFFFVLSNGMQLHAGNSTPRPTATGGIPTKTDDAARVRLPLAKIPNTILLLKKLSPIPCPEACEKIISLIEQKAEFGSLAIVTAGITACLTHVEEQSAAYKPAVRQFLKRSLNDYLTKVTGEFGSVNRPMTEINHIDGDIRGTLVRLGNEHSDLLSPAANTLYRAIKKGDKEVTLADLKLGIDGFIALLDVLEQEQSTSTSEAAEKRSGSGAHFQTARSRLQSFREYVEKAELLAMGTLTDRTKQNREFFDFVPRVRIPTASVPRPQTIGEIDLTDTDDFDIDPLVEELSATHAQLDTDGNTAEKTNTGVDEQAQSVPTRQEPSTPQQTVQGTCSIPAPTPLPCVCPTGPAPEIAV